MKIDLYVIAQDCLYRTSLTKKRQTIVSNTDIMIIDIKKTSLYSVSVYHCISMNIVDRLSLLHLDYMAITVENGWI